MNQLLRILEESKNSGFSIDENFSWLLVEQHRLYHFVYSIETRKIAIAAQVGVNNILQQQDETIRNMFGDLSQHYAVVLAPDISHAQITGGVFKSLDISADFDTASLTASDNKITNTFYRVGKYKHWYNDRVHSLFADALLVTTAAEWLRYALKDQPQWGCYWAGSYICGCGTSVFQQNNPDELIVKSLYPVIQQSNNRYIDKKPSSPALKKLSWVKMDMEKLMENWMNLIGSGRVVKA